jgi:hypothetical protein
MSTSPPIEIKGSNPEVSARPQLVYISEIFKTTMMARPLATLQVSASSDYYASQIIDALVNLHIPRSKINPIVASGLSTSPSIGTISLPPGFNLNTQYTALIWIDYGDGKPKQRVSVQFKRNDTDFPVEVDFEIAPDGSMLTEVEAEWSTPLKFKIADSARMGVREVKFATKIVGIAGFEQKTVNNIETELKAKLKQTLSFYLKTSGHEHVKITFYGAIGAKYADDKIKPIGEAGFLFEVPFDLTDILK